MSWPSGPLASSSPPRCSSCSRRRSWPRPAQRLPPRRPADPDRPRSPCAALWRRLRRRFATGSRRASCACRSSPGTLSRSHPFAARRIRCPAAGACSGGCRGDRGAYPEHLRPPHVGRDADVDDRGPLRHLLGLRLDRLARVEPAALLRDGTSQRTTSCSTPASTTVATPTGYGGWASWTAAYLLRWGGPVARLPGRLWRPRLAVRARAGQAPSAVARLPAATPATNDVVKAAIVTYGAVDTSMYSDRSSYTSDAVPAYYYCRRASGRPTRSTSSAGTTPTPGLQVPTAPASRRRLPLPQQLGHGLRRLRLLLGELLRQADHDGHGRLPCRAAGRPTTRTSTSTTRWVRRTTTVWHDDRMDGQQIRRRRRRVPRGRRLLACRPPARPTPSTAEAPRHADAARRRHRHVRRVPDGRVPDAGRA